jgi:hypothetical protein
MRPFTAPSVLLALTLVACNPDAGSNPLAAPDEAPTASRGASDNSSSATSTKHIDGTFDAVETDQVQPGTTLLVMRLEGSGIASHLGRYTAVAEFTVNFATGAGGGSITFTAANGDRLVATETGQATDANGIADITETATITGGTGRFVGATGMLTIQRRLDLATGVSQGHVEGTIETLP